MGLQDLVLCSDRTCSLVRTPDQSRWSCSLEEQYGDREPGTPRRVALVLTVGLGQVKLDQIRSDQSLSRV